MTAPPRPRRSPRTLATARFRVFRSSFAVATRSALALEFLRRLYGPSVVGHEAPWPETFSLGGRDGRPGRRWDVYLGDRRLAGAPSLGAALNRLEREICLRIVAHHPDLIAIHGATVLADGGAAFLSGPSGAGKSTLALALAARGYRVGGDVVVLLDPRDGTIRPVPRCFHLDGRSRQLLRCEGLAMPDQALRYGFMTPAELGMTDAPASPVRFLLFLGRGPGREPRLSTLSQAEMTVRLLSETARGAHSPSQIMAALAPMVGASARYELSGGRLSDTAEAVAELLGEARSAGTRPVQ